MKDIVEAVQDIVNSCGTLTTLTYLFDGDIVADDSLKR